MVKKFLSILTVTTVILSNLPNVTVNAADNTTSEDGAIQSLVTSQIASSWVVTVPENIGLSGNQGSYEASLSGDVANTTAISVIPNSQFTMTNGEVQVTAHVKQEKQSWLGSEITTGAISTTGTIEIKDDMPAGTYVGSLNFQVNCTEDLDNLLAKVEMMKSIDLYCLGDSIIDGYLSGTNGFCGTAETIDNLYGTKTFKNYAVTGASLTQMETLRPSIHQQAYLVLDRIKNSGGTTRTTAIVLDGGVNDIILDKADNTKTFTINNFSDDIANGHYDFSTTMSQLLYLFGEYSEQSSKPMDYPIIYIIPKADEHNAELEQIKAAMEQAQTIYPNLIILDTRDMFTASDIAEDFTHLNSAGQAKLAHKIVDALYDYYN